MIEYRRTEITPAITAFVFKKSDVNNKQCAEEIYSLFPKQNYKLLMGARWLEMNGYRKYVSGIPLDKNTEKMFLVVVDAPGETQEPMYASSVTDTE